MDKPTNYWDYFDKIYCISLDERSDRREEAKNQFNKIGLLEFVEFIIVKKHPQDSEEGIFESHMACIQKGLAAGAGNIVIFEDDVMFDGFTPKSLKLCIDFMRDTPGWKAIFFGCLVSGSRRTHNKSVLSIKYRSLTHAYVLNRNFAELLVKVPWRKIAFDTALKSYQDGFYVAFPAFAFQSNSPTGNNKYLRLDQFRRLCGGLWRIQKRNEWYHRNQSLITALHVLFVLLIVIWFFR
jgi:GR25 family glycosyltransferase involved in LPS biosynthesis